MIISDEALTELYRKRFDRMAYNCVDFTCEAALALFNVKLSKLKDPYTTDFRLSLYNLKRVPTLPRFGVIVLTRGTTHHVGIAFTGDMLHIIDSGVRCEPLAIAALTFDRRRFFTW